MAELVEFRAATGWRVIANPSALDALETATARVVRISADDALVITTAAATEPPFVVGDEHAIVTPEHGFDIAELTAEQLDHLRHRHIEWQLPDVGLGQGFVAGVPAKLVIDPSGGASLLVASVARHDLQDRING